MAPGIPIRRILLAGLLWSAPAPAHCLDLAENIHVDDRLLPDSFGGILALALIPPLIPYFLATNLDHYGFTRHPYEGPKIYGQGERLRAFTAAASRQFIQGRRSADHFFARYRDEERFGLDLAASTFEGGAFGRASRAGHYAMHATANYLQADQALLEFGMGAAVIQDPVTSWGPSWDLGLELFPAKPLTLSILYQADLLDGIGMHTISAGTGITYRGVGVGAGYRAFLRPGPDAHGPELTLRAWF